MHKVRIHWYDVIVMSIASVLMGLPLYFGLEWRHALLLHALFTVAWIIWAWASNSFDNLEQAAVFLMFSFMLMTGARLVDHWRSHHHPQPPVTSDRDVTYDFMNGNFQNVVGIWKAKRPLWLLVSPKRGFYVGPDGARDSDNYSALAQLPIHTEIQVVQLIEHDTAEAKPTYSVTGWIASGPRAGTACEFDPSLFAKPPLPQMPTTAPAGPLRRSWEVNADVLEK